MKLLEAEPSGDNNCALTTTNVPALRKQLSNKGQLTVDTRAGETPDRQGWRKVLQKERILRGGKYHCNLDSLFVDVGHQSNV